MQTDRELEARVAALERRSERQRCAWWVLVAIVVALALCGAASNAVMPLLKAREVRVVDEAGKTKILLSADRGVVAFGEAKAGVRLDGDGVRVADAAGNNRVGLNAALGVVVADHDGKAVVMLTADDGVSVSGRDGKAVVMLKADGVTVSTCDGKDRALRFVRLTDQAVSVYDRDGDIGAVLDATGVHLGAPGP